MKTVKRTAEFAAWLHGLKDVKAQAKITQRIDRLALGNPGDSRNLKGGVSELKVDFGPGYRVYFTEVQKVIIILICGGDKSTQQADIKAATAQVDAIKAEVEADLKAKAAKAKK